MRLAATLMLTLALAAATGCAAVRVREKDPDGGRIGRLPGIPFYTKVERFDQTTIYEKKWYVAKLIDVTEGFDSGSGKREVVLGAILLKEPDSLRRVRRLVADLGSDEEGHVDLEGVRNEFFEVPTIRGADDVRHEPVSNSFVSVVVPDYSRVHYINGSYTVFGASSLTAKLHSDGTLTEATGATDTKLAEGISTLLPIKEVLSSMLLPPAANALMPGGTQRYLRLEVEPKGLVFTFRKRHKRTSKGKVPMAALKTPIPFNTSNGNYTVKPLGAPAKKPDDKNKVSFSGEVKLPK